MAYGIKYRLSWCAPDGTPLRYEILENGYSGAIIDVEGSGNPFVLKKLNDKGKKGTIITTEAEIEIRESGNFSVEDIYTSDEREYQVKHYYNNVFSWAGYLLPDYFSKEVEGFPVLKLSAIDQLGTLKDVPFQQTNGELYTGKTTLLKVLTECLKHTGIDFNLKVIVDIESPDWDSIDPIEPARSLSFFRDTYVDMDRFSDHEGNVVSVYDVLETTLNLCNSKIFIQDGFFWVVNKRQIELATGNIITFSLSGQQIGTPVPLASSTINFDILSVGGSQQIEAADSVTQVYSEHGPQIPIPKNSDFKGYSGSSYPNWTNHNGYEIEPTSVEPVRYDASGNVISTQPLATPRPWIKSLLTFEDIASSKVNIATNPYMESDAIPISAERSESITLTLALRGHYNDPVVAVMLLEGYAPNGTPNGRDYILSDSGEWMPYSGDSRTNVTRNFIEFRLPKPEGRTSTQPYAVELSNFTITTSKLPSIDRASTSFKLVLRIYGHTGGGAGSKYMMVLKSLSVSMAAVNDPKGIIYAFRNNRRYSKQSDPMVTLFSDKVDIGENGNFTAIGKDITSTITTRSGKLTRTWIGLGSSGDYLNMLVAKQVSLSYAVSHKLLHVEVDNVNLSFLNRYTFGCIEGIYVLVASDVDYKNGTTYGTFAQIVDVSLNATRSITTTLDSDKGTGIKGVGSIAGGGGGSAPQDLQSVTDIGSETTNIITVKGLRANELLELPDNEPALSDRVAGKTYLYSNPTGGGSSPAPTMGNLEDLQNVDDVIPVNRYLYKGSDGIWRGAEVDLTGLASQSWVNSSFVPVTRTVNGKALSSDITLTAGDVGALTQASADGRYVTLSTKQTISGAKNFSAALGMPNAEPAAADRVAGVTYIYANADGSGSTPAPTMGNLEDLQNVASTIANNRYLFKGADGIWRGVEISLPDLSGYATQSWVNSQLSGYVPTSRTVNGKALAGDIVLTASDVGALTQSTADGRYVTLSTKQEVSGAKYFSGALGIPNDAPTSAQRVAGVTYLYANGDGSGSSPAPLIADLEDLQNVQNTIANGKFLQKVSGVWTGVDIPIPDLSGYALQSWVNTNFAKTNDSRFHTHSNKAVLDGITSGKVSNWDAAYGWGDFREYGLGAWMQSSNSPNSWDFDDLTGNSIHRGTNHGITGISDNIYGISFINSTTSRYGGHIAIHATTDSFWLQSYSDGVKRDWREIWHSGNLRSNSQNDSRYYTINTSLTGVSMIDLPVGNYYGSLSTMLTGKPFNQVGGILSVGSNGAYLVTNRYHSSEPFGRLAIMNFSSSGSKGEWAEVWTDKNHIHRTDSQNDDRYVYKTGGTINGNLSIDGIADFYLKTGWYLDSLMNERMYVGTSSSINGIIFRASHQNHRFQIRDINSATVAYIDMHTGDAVMNSLRITSQEPINHIELTRNFSYIANTNASGELAFITGGRSTAASNSTLRLLSNGDASFMRKVTAPAIRATQALGIPTGAPPAAQREAGVTYFYAIQ